MKKHIEIHRNPYEEPFHINLIVKASNGTQAGEIEIYDNGEKLKLIASSLESFPKHNTDTYLWELGSERSEDKFAFFFRFRVYVINLSGSCAIQLRFNNNQDYPDLAITDFCIKAEPAGINRLGKLFREFSKLEKRKLFWDGVEGQVM